MARIGFTREADKQRKTLNEPTKSRIADGISKLPAGDVKKLQGYVNLYRLRIGTYRVIFEQIGEDLLIYAILPRGSAYKNL